MNNVSFDLDDGSSLGIVGQNGAGKSTVSSLILGELKPTSGRIEFSGDLISGLNPNLIAQKGIGKTFQHTNIFPQLTVFENVKLGTMAAQRYLGVTATLLRRPASYTEEDTIAVLKLLGLEDRLRKTVQDLGLGDKRRLEIAIALATKPKLLIMDEPTAGISSQEIDEMIQLLKELTRRVTLMLIEHDMDVMTSVVKRVIMMHNGSVIADGPTHEIMSSEDVRSLYLGR